MSGVASGWHPWRSLLVWSGVTIIAVQGVLLPNDGVAGRHVARPTSLPGRASWTGGPRGRRGVAEVFVKLTRGPGTILGSSRAGQLVVLRFRRGDRPTVVYTQLVGTTGISAGLGVVYGVALGHPAAVVTASRPAVDGGVKGISLRLRCSVKCATTMGYLGFSRGSGDTVECFRVRCFLRGRPENAVVPGHETLTEVLGGRPHG